MTWRGALLLTVAVAVEAAGANVFETLAPSIVRVRAFKGEAILHDGSGLVREDFEYGTGFAVEPFLIVTAKHTIIANGVPSKSVHCWSPIRKRYEGCTIVYVSPDRDIAVLWYPQMQKAHLTLAASVATTRDHVLIAGFPDTPYAKPRVIIGEGDLLSWNATAPGGDHIPDRRKLASADAIAFPGCSGGPVLTDKLEVVGMVVSIMENDDGQWTGTTYFLRSDEIRAALDVARKSIQKKKGYEFLPAE